MDVLRHWTIRVCAHGHRVEYRENYGGWLHMDADSDVCKSDEPPEVVRVTTDSGAVGALERIEAYFHDGWPDESDVRDIERTVRTTLRAIRGR